MRKGRKQTDATKEKISQNNGRYWLGKKRPGVGGRHKGTHAKINPEKIRRGENHHSWKGGLSKNKGYMSWMKNKRNRIIKRLKKESLSHTFGDWELLKKQYGFTCPACGKSEPQIKLTEDHIIPLSRGGSDLIENIQPLCKSCNCKKYNKIIKYD